MIGIDYSTAEKHSSYPTHLTKLQRREYTSTHNLFEVTTDPNYHISFGNSIKINLTALKGLFSGLSFTTSKIILQC